MDKSKPKAGKSITIEEKQQLEERKEKLKQIELEDGQEEEA